MAAVTPPQLLPNYQLLAAAATTPSQGIFIPLATLTALTAAEADTATGDGRKVAFEIIRALFTAYNALAVASRPTRLSITRGTPAGVDAAIVRQAFTLSFDLDISAADVTAEV